MPSQDLSTRKVSLVDSDDNVIGETGLLDAHKGEGKLHRAISVFLFRKSPENEGEIELLIQQRSQEKIVGANQWANTVCGNVNPGESYVSCAIRRLREELGIADVSEESLRRVEKFQYQVRCNKEYSENEMDQVFAAWWDSDLKENPAEVRQTKWVNWKEVGGLSYLAPWFVIMLQKKSLMKKINKFVLKSR